MKRFDSQRAVFKGMGAVSQAKIAVLAADLGIAHASIAVLEEIVEKEAGGLTREQAAIHEIRDEWGQYVRPRPWNQWRW